jgi:hypothetical protein
MSQAKQREKRKIDEERDTVWRGQGMTYRDFSEVQFCTRLCFVLGKCIAGMKKRIIGLGISV